MALSEEYEETRRDALDPYSLSYLCLKRHVNWGRVTTYDNW